MNANNSIRQRQMINQLSESFSKKYRFQKYEVERLLTKFQEIVKEKEKMDRSTFCNMLYTVFEMTDDFMIDRVFKAFDKDNDSQINQEEWVRGMCIFLRGTTDDKVKFCFDVYDINSDGYISREEMFQLLKTSFIKQTSDEDPDEAIKDLVEIIHKILDQDRDNRVSFSDYNKAFKHQPLILECLGECLPAQKFRDGVELYLSGTTDDFQLRHECSL